MNSRLRRFAPVATAVVVVLLSLVALVASPSGAAVPGSTRADYVVIAGAPGLRWDDLSEQGTPALWQLAQHGSIGALSVSSARRVTCAADGWVTLGAGNLAEWTQGPVGSQCPPMSVAITSPDHIGAFVADQHTVVEESQQASWGARPGALAESVRCAVAVGPGAAVAAARPIGRVDRYVESLPADPSKLLSECVLSIVDLGQVAGTGAARAAAVRRVDQGVAKLMGARPADSTLMVAGLADTDTPSRLHVAIVDGPGYGSGWLASPTTARSGYLQLFDLAPTALAALDKPVTSKLFAGQPADRLSGRPASLTAAVAALDDADRQAGAQRGVAGWFFVALVALELALLVAAAPILWRARRGAGAFAVRPAPPKLRRLLEVALVAAGLAVPAAIAADVVPWWRTGAPGLVFAAGWLVAVAVLTALVLASRLRRPVLGPTAAAAGLAAAVVVLDVIGGAKLQFNGVAGYSALSGGRYAGIGTIALGVVVAVTALLGGSLAQQVRQQWRPVLVAAVGAAGVVVVGSPYLGADAAGAIGLTAGVCVAVVMATGGWLTTTRLAFAVLSVLAVTGAFGILELSRPPARRGSLGQFLTAVGDGSAGALIRRAGAANVAAVATSPLTMMALAGGLYVFVVLLQPWGGLKRLFGIYPAVRATVTGLIVAALLCGLLNGAGFTVAGAAAAVALPLLTLAALRASVHADERTFTSGARSGRTDEELWPSAPPRGTLGVAQPDAAAPEAVAQPDTAAPEAVALPDAEVSEAEAAAAAEETDDGERTSVVRDTVPPATVESDGVLP